jgi:DNA-binding LacI/PurR family transcriptional regulator
MSIFPSKRATMHDVARLSGVSYQTVSRVINNHPNVAAATRDRVLAAITELDYRPNKAAQSLAGRRSQMLAVITVWLDHYGPSQMMINIDKTARDAGYDLIIANAADCSGDNIRAAVHYLKRWQVDGVLAITPIPGLTYQEIVDLCGVPVVLIDTQPGTIVPSVVVDQRLGSEIITQHLIDLGHTRICEISGPLAWFGALARHDGWEATIRGNGLTPGRSLAGNWSARSGYQCARQLLAEEVNFTALVAGNDQMALGAMRAFKDAGLCLPDDVSVVGFDDIPEAAYFDPPLTTICQDFDELAAQGIAYLVERINQPDAPPEQRRIVPVLYRRGSSVPPIR